jgi:hypothetical protein
VCIKLQINDRKINISTGK